ncbi:hypothetical protein AB6P12_01200 [Streptococcus mutans]|uniref:hypothetical protein n=1 Tax=Streptococcus mutans TaxID=1309 RepID=UPI0002B5C487|nr:hypothetical protein [Streptococcus mutans]EMC49477.1 ATP synthase delta subunit [Streptococcus mutans SA41]
MTIESGISTFGETTDLEKTLSLMLIEQTTYQKKWIESFEKVNGRKSKSEEPKEALEGLFFCIIFSCFHFIISSSRSLRLSNSF